MAPPRKKGKKGKKPKYAAVVGLVGSGKVTVKAAKSHLSDFIERFSEDGEILWVLPDTEDVTKSLTAVKNFLWEEEATYVLVSDGTFGDDDWTDNAKTVVEVETEDVYASLVTEVSGYEAENLAVIFILDEDHDGDVELLEAASSEGLTCYDLTAGLNELELEDAEEEATEEDEDVAEEVESAEEVEDEEEAEEGDTAPAIPEKVQALIDKGKVEQAAAKLTEAMDRDELADLSDQLGVGAKTKGVWAKTIAKNIVEYLSPEGDEPEAEEEPEEKPAAKKKTRKTKAEKKATEPEPEVEDEVVAIIDETGPDANTGGGELAQVDPNFEALRLRAEVISASSYVAGQKGADEAGKYIAVLKKAGLLV